MTTEVTLTADFGGLHRMLQDWHVKQVPFATALALTRLARGAAEVEADEVRKTFDNPTPFTQRSFFVTSATKANQIAYVSAKDIQAQYLLPYVIGGMRYLGQKRAMLVPRAIAVNQYGNLPRGKLQQLQGKRGIFVGKVKTKAGQTISGVWQRPVVATKGKGSKRSATAKAATGLKLLVRFEDTTPTRKHLPFVERARAYVQANAREEIDKALREAARTARRV